MTRATRAPGFEDQGRRAARTGRSGRGEGMEGRGERAGGEQGKDLAAVGPDVDLEVAAGPTVAAGEQAVELAVEGVAGHVAEAAGGGRQDVAEAVADPAAGGREQDGRLLAAVRQRPGRQPDLEREDLGARTRSASERVA